MKSDIIIAGVFLFMVYQDVAALPLNRVKRVSDQRLAELETLVALSKMSGKLVTVPLGFGKVDPKMIGRKRRSDSRMLNSLFSQSSEEDAGDPVESNFPPNLYAVVPRKR